MKAIRYYGPQDCRFEEIETPQPGPDEVLIRVKAVGICATDVEVYDGVMFYFTSGMTRIPITPGHEWSGEVAAVGAGVKAFQPGDKVCGECSVGCRQCRYCLRGWYNQCPNRTETGLLNRDGAFAEYIVFPQHFLHPCNGLTFEAGSCVEPVGVALYAIKQAAVSPEDSVVVFGAGPIGLFMMQAARAYGARKVIAVDLLAYRCQKGIEMGADAAVNPREEDLAARIKDLTGGHMADVVIESSGKAAVWGAIPPILAPRARIGVVGLTGGEPGCINFDPLVVNNITIRGTVGGPNCWAEAIDLVERGVISPQPLITHRLPLDQFETAIEITKNRLDNAIKVILQP